MLCDEIVAPQGWRWMAGTSVLSLNTVMPDDLSKENDVFFEVMENVFNWAKENDLKTLNYDRTSYTFNVEGLNHEFNVYPFTSFEFWRAENWTHGESGVIANTEFNCEICGHEEKKHSSLFCHNCLTLFYCNNCHRYRDAAHYDQTSALVHCANCGVKCECGRYHGGYLNNCATCTPAFKCQHCHGYSNEETLSLRNSDDNEDELLCCEWCRSIYCHGCNMFTDEETNEDHLCVTCVFLGEDGDKEMFDDVSISATKLQLPSIPGREMIRLSGVEIEGGLGKTPSITGQSGPNTLARALYDSQLSENYMQEGYHHGRGFARIETDASCDWECVIGPINMADVTHVRKLNNVVKIIKDHIKTDLLKLDLRCGTHIHVAADKVSLAQAYNLHLLYTYMEDPLYRLGAANWPIHRILINDEEHSAARSPKETSKTKFARTFHGNRYYGLSFNNYFERMLEDCRCGASRYGVFEECACDLRKCTFEFRLFNSTANTIKLHAYLALCQALVAKAISMPEIKDPNLFEAFPFEMSRLRDMPGDKQKKMIDGWDERLRYIATDLPLTDDEKKSIYYCVKNSELVKVDSAKELFKGEN